MRTIAQPLDTEMLGFCSSERRCLEVDVDSASKLMSKMLCSNLLNLVFLMKVIPTVTLWERANLANTLVQVEFPKATLEQFYIIDRLHHTAVFLAALLVSSTDKDRKMDQCIDILCIANPSSQYQKNRHAHYQDGYSRHLPPSIGQISLCCTCFKDFDLPNF